MAAVAMALASAFGYGSAAIFIRLAVQGIGTRAGNYISVVTSFLPAMVLALAFAMEDLKALPPIAFAWLAGLGALNFAGGRSFTYEAIGRIGAARTTAILSTSAIFAAVLAITISGERPHPLVLLGTVLVLAGLAGAFGRTLLEGGKMDRRALWGYAAAVASAACIGGTNVLVKELTGRYGSPLAISAVSLGFGMLLLTPLAGQATIESIVRAGRNNRFVFHAGMSGLAGAVAIIFLYSSLRAGDISVVSPIVAGNPLVTLLLAQLFISRLENLTGWLAMGTVVVVSGVALVVVGSTL